jgi:hypothetical protein
MSAMEPSTASQPPTSEPERTDATHTGRTEKPYGDHYHKPVTVPDLVGPDFPFPPSVAKFFRKLFRRKATPAPR